MTITKFAKLSTKILDLSHNQAEFAVAVKEWSLLKITKSEKLHHCLCGKAIKELCYITNKVTMKQACVGNECINRFIEQDLHTTDMFRCLDKITDDNTASLNVHLLNYAFVRGYINAWEKGFLENTARKQVRTMSEKQLATRVKVNRLIIAKVKM